MVISEKRVSRQRQSPGKGWPQLEAGELGNSQEARASGTEETRGKKRRQPYWKAGRQRAPLYMPGLLSVPHMPSSEACQWLWPYKDTSSPVLSSLWNGWALTVSSGSGDEGKESR